MRILINIIDKNKSNFILDMANCLDQCAQSTLPDNYHCMHALEHINQLHKLLVLQNLFTTRKMLPSL